MARNGSGVYSPPAADYPAVASTLIESTKFNNVIDDISTALSGSIAADGQTTVTANLPMNSKKFTGLASGSARTDSAALGQVQDGTANWVDGSGTADAITATYSPAITTLIDGQICFVRATAANATTTPTFSPNGLTARTIVKKGGSALVAGDIEADGHELILRYLLASTRWELLNPASGSFSGAISGTTITGSFTVRGNTATGTTTSSAVVAVASGTGTGTYSTSVNGVAIHAEGGDTGVYGLTSGAASVGVAAISSHASYTGSVFYGNTTRAASSAFNLLALYANSVLKFSVDGTGAVSASSSILSSSATAGIGYTTGAGGSVTQSTSKSTAVTLNTLCGHINTHDASLAANTAVGFTFNNSSIGLYDTLIVNLGSSAETNGAYCLNVRGASAGVRYIMIRNLTAGALAETIGISFAVIKGTI